jgi:hypothetical protein
VGMVRTGKNDDLRSGKGGGMKSCESRLNANGFHIQLLLAFAALCLVVSMGNTVFPRYLRFPRIV